MRRSTEAKLRDWMGVTSAAEQLGLHRNSILSAVRTGRIEGCKVDGRVMVYRPSVDAYQKKRQAKVERWPVGDDAA